MVDLPTTSESHVFIALDVQYLLSSACHRKKWIDLEKLVGCLRQQYKNHQVKIYAYLLNNGEKPSRLESLLSRLGCELSVKVIKSKPSGSSSAHDVKITLDVVDLLPTMDIVVLVTGKLCYTDLVQRIRLYNKKIHLFGFSWSMSEILSSCVDEVYALEHFDVLEESRNYEIREGSSSAASSSSVEVPQAPSIT